MTYETGGGAEQYEADRAQLIAILDAADELNAFRQPDIMLQQNAPTGQTETQAIEEQDLTPVVNQFEHWHQDVRSLLAADMYGAVPDKAQVSQAAHMITENAITSLAVHQQPDPFSGEIFTVMTAELRNEPMSVTVRDAVLSVHQDAVVKHLRILERDTPLWEQPKIYAAIWQEQSDAHDPTEDAKAFFETIVDHEGFQLLADLQEQVLAGESNVAQVEALLARYKDDPATRAAADEVIAAVLDQADSRRQAAELERMVPGIARPDAGTLGWYKGLLDEMRSA